MALSRKIKAGLLALLLIVGLWYFPPLHSRLAWRVDELRARIWLALNPPDALTFRPEATLGPTLPP
ncbi:MAG: hypothetical protein ACK8QZ_04910, partial [Anaerolineales bacterium]